MQQQDLHLETSTVRESLRFSAVLRQPKTVTKAEKHEHVESVIDMLGMQDFAEAVVGVPGEGLNVEQRKLLTIGVELAAKPGLLLFLDEPTSGLDSQSSWAICAILRKLADHGQAILCTIHRKCGTGSLYTSLAFHANIFTLNQNLALSFSRTSTDSSSFEKAARRYTSATLETTLGRCWTTLSVMELVDVRPRRTPPNT